MLKLLAPLLLFVCVGAQQAIAQSPTPPPIYRLRPAFQPLPLPPLPQLSPGFVSAAPPGLGPPPTFSPLAFPPGRTMALAPATEDQVHTIDDLARAVVSSPPVNIKLTQSPVFARMQFLGYLPASEKFRVSRLWRDERGALVLLTEDDYDAAGNVLRGEFKTTLWRAPSGAGLWRITWASQHKQYELAVADPHVTDADVEIEAHRDMVLDYANSVVD